MTSATMAPGLNSVSAGPVLTINGGSSSLRFALFSATGSLARLLSGKFERIGLTDASVSVADVRSGRREEQAIPAPDHAACVPLLIELLERQAEVTGLGAIAHRIVHGGM